MNARRIFANLGKRNLQVKVVDLCIPGDIVITWLRLRISLLVRNKILLEYSEGTILTPTLASGRFRAYSAAP